ncbi:hypothetical protein ZIOFF_011248 [Zingiber officinale]|uniref:Uncharacterized protein n=2 Tax=Zingiber officinale TaxID=94328 RepID=A0A8J5M0W7_ZINOF|nr:hypothetical protein ZIOFF_011248 [Zingiber officinale]
MKDQEPCLVKTPGATTRKLTYNDRKYSESSYHADDEDGTNKKYTRRGPFRNKFLRMLLPFWSNALPTLPVTAPAPRNGAHEGKVRHQKSSRMDTRKILLIIAIMACMATMGILYYRLAQDSLDESTQEDDLQ